MNERAVMGPRVGMSGMVEMESGEEPTLLLVDDDAPLRRSLQRALERRGFRVFPGESYREGLNLIHSLKISYRQRLKSKRKRQARRVGTYSKFLRQ